MPSTGLDEVRAPPTERVIVVDDEDEPRQLVTRAVSREGFEVVACHSARAALDAIRAEPTAAALLLTDLGMPEMSGLELLAVVHDHWPDLPVILVTGATELAVAVSAMRSGAYDYLSKPVHVVNTLLPAVRRALEHGRLLKRNRFLQSQLDVAARSAGIVGDSKAMRDVHALVASVAPTDATVLVLGESGTGKELVARAIHDQSRRAGKAFVDVNCGALTESVLESELFGHAKGAFTGAGAARRGLFEEASGGTIFLDEVGELSAATQVRLLRVLQERQVRPVGANETRDIDVRVVAATNRDLAQQVQSGAFRQDLYYRLDVLTIDVPPLRERPKDVPALVHHFLRKRSARLGKEVLHVEPEVLERLSAYGWPGNVRELENAVERAIVLAKGDTFTVDLLPAVLRAQASLQASGHSEAWLLSPMAEAKTSFERRYLERLMERTDGKLGRAAQLAGVDPSNLRRLLKRHGITDDD
ncbi:MAG: sigma-54 dependent transcriptional regulator [Polyangiaceae bacterium]